MPSIQFEERPNGKIERRVSKGRGRTADTLKYGFNELVGVVIVTSLVSESIGWMRMRMRMGVDGIKVSHQF